jgi:hypothetical protein
MPCATAAPAAIDTPHPEPDEASSELVELRVTLPVDIEVSLDVAEQTLLAFSNADGPISFEIMGTGKQVTLQFVVRSEDATAVRRTIESFHPDAVVTEERSRLEVWVVNHAAARIATADFGLSREFMLPLRTCRSLAVDPLTGILGTLESLGPDELGIVQVIFARTAYPWAESIIRAVSDGEGGSFFGDAPDMPARAREKLGRPMFACVLRVAAWAPDLERAYQLRREFGLAFSQFADPGSNELIALSNDNYEDGIHGMDLVNRQSRRSGMLLSVEELASVVHLPSATVRCPSLRTPPRRTKALPETASSGEIGLGENVHRGTTSSVRLRNELRLRHTYVIGATGTGKSTLLLSLIRQDIEAGRGIGLIDPHGDLVEDVLALIPKERHKDVVLFDPSDDEYPVGFNILRAHSDREKELLSSDLVSIFHRFSTSWGDQMSAVLGNAVLALLESERGGTLLDLRRFLADKSFRDEFLTSVRDPSVVAFWRREFSLLSGRPQVPLLTRLDAFLRPRSIRMVVAQRESKFDLGQLMNGSGIFLAKLSQGAIGEENARLLGSLLVAKFQQIALAREQRRESERRDFFLYLDEFHHFVTPSLASLLAGARKYHVGLVLAHQEFGQLGDRNLEGSVLTNPATRICFRLGDEDARKLAAGFASFDAEDLQSLGVGEAICRLERADQDFNLRVASPGTATADVAETRRKMIRSSSRSRLGTPRAEVEAVFAEVLKESPHVGTAPSRGGDPEESLPKRTPTAADRTSLPVEPMKFPVPDRPDGSASRSRPRATPQPAEVEATAGRGGAQHKYLQSLIKHYGEEKGFRATLEAPVTGGGRVDILLENAALSIACEISIGSSPTHELGNLEKCLRGGFVRIALISPERKTLKKIAALAEAGLSSVDRARVAFVTPDEFLVLLEETAVRGDAREATILGYRVKTSIKSLQPDEQESRKDSVLKTILRSLKRVKDRGDV